MIKVFIDKSYSVPFIVDKLAVQQGDSIIIKYGINDPDEISNLYEVTINEYKDGTVLVFDGKSFECINRDKLNDWSKSTFIKWLDKIEVEDPFETVERIEQLYDILRIDIPIEQFLKQHFNVGSTHDTE